MPLFPTMKERTPGMITREIITKGIRTIFPHATILKKHSFSQGLMNRTILLTIKKPSKEVIFRIYPKELWKAEKERFLYQITKKRGIPVPRCLGSGKNYLILSKVEGTPLPVDNAHAVAQAGEVLGKIHSIPFQAFGWIVGTTIKPAFKTWFDFLVFDTKEKCKKIPTKKGTSELKKTVLKILKKSKPVLSKVRNPCLVHKDYHTSHIFVRGNIIQGIIDFEWAIAGDPCLDIAKACLWMFSKKPAMEKIFLKGYRRTAPLGDEFDARRQIYKVLTLFSALSLAYERNHQGWILKNTKALKKVIRDEYNKNYL